MHVKVWARNAVIINLPYLFCLQVFHDVAYKAKDRNDLIAGIDEFLDQVTVLPPGEWDPSIRIEPPKNVPSQVSRNLVSLSQWHVTLFKNLDLSNCCGLFVKQEKRKKTIPNGLVEGDEEEEDGGHGGPELQRTGRWGIMGWKNVKCFCLKWLLFTTRIIFT